MTIKEKRDKHIAERVQASKSRRIEIKRIAAELYLSERTVYHILRKNCKGCKT